jgi:hypothetical protein
MKRPTLNFPGFFSSLMSSGQKPTGARVASGARTATPASSPSSGNIFIDAMRTKIGQNGGKRSNHIVNAPSSPPEQGQNPFVTMFGSGFPRKK